MPVNLGAQPTEVNLNSTSPAIPAGKQTVTFQSSAAYPDPNNGALKVRDVSAYTSLANFVGDSGSGGQQGLVPAPAAGDAAAGKILKADGTWAIPGLVGAGGATTVTFGTATSTHFGLSVYTASPSLSLASGHILHIRLTLNRQSGTGNYQLLISSDDTNAYYFDLAGSGYVTAGYYLGSVATRLTTLGMTTQQTGVNFIDIWLAVQSPTTGGVGMGELSQLINTGGSFQFPLFSGDTHVDLTKGSITLYLLTPDAVNDVIACTLESSVPVVQPAGASFSSIVAGPSDPSVVPATIEEAVGQTADAFEVKNSSGTVIAKIGPDGNITWPGNLTSANSIAITSTGTGQTINFIPAGGLAQVWTTATSPKFRIHADTTTAGYELWKDSTPTKAIFVGMSNPSVSGVADDVLFATYNGTAWSERLRVLNANGNMGIGTTTPHSKLAVVGLPVYANNAAAITGGLAAGDFYRDGGDPDHVCVVH